MGEENRDTNREVIPVPDDETVATHSEIYFVVAICIVGLILPLSMATLSFLYLVPFYTFAGSVSLATLLSSPRLSLKAHAAPIMICVAMSIVQGMWLYGLQDWANDPTGHLIVYVAAPLGMFLGSYVFFRATMRKYKWRLNGSGDGRERH
jgi:hypothetical protein